MIRSGILEIEVEGQEIEHYYFKKDKFRKVC